MRCSLRPLDENYENIFVLRFHKMLTAEMKMQLSTQSI